MPETKTQEEILASDPFYDENVQLDLRDSPQHFADLPSDETPIVDELQPEPEVEVAPEPPAAPEPQVVEYEDGSSVTIEKTKKGWRAVLESATGGSPEVFYGATKDEMYLNVAAGKIQATKKIREQNRTIKLNSPVIQAEPVRQTSRELTADEIFTLKAQQEENPGQAIETYVKTKYGRSLGEIVESAERGNAAQLILARESAGREFAQTNPDYYPVDDNYWSMVKWLAKFKLQKNLNAANESDLLNELTVRGLYTVDTLTEAFEDLKDSGLISFSPQPVEVEPEPEPQPAPAPRVAENATRRPRPAVGIRTSNVRPPRVEAPAELPKNLDDLTDEQIAELYKGVQNLARTRPEFVKSSIQATRDRRG